MRTARRSTLAALALLITFTAAWTGPCSGKEQPQTVADILVSLGDIKRDLRARGEITPQTSYDISNKLAAANRAYRVFITDEQARLATVDANISAPDPEARRQAINALVTSLRALEDPSAIGIKSETATKIWRAGVKHLPTIISGLEVLRGGGQ